MIRNTKKYQNAEASILDIERITGSSRKIWKEIIFWKKKWASTVKFCGSDVNLEEK